MANFQPKIKKLLTRPILKLEIGVARFVKIEAPMFVGKEIKKGRGSTDDKPKEPATLVHVINLGAPDKDGNWVPDGSENQIVLNAVLKGHLTDDYPNDGYVGKCFMIQKMEKERGKQYNPFNIAEIEDPSGEVSNIQQSSAKRR
jgi:hypothetical protein